MPPINQSSWNYGISASPLSAYTDDETLPADLVKFVTSDRQAAEVQVMTSNNEGHATGNDWATEQWVDKHDVNIPFTIDPTMKMLVRLLNAALGQVSTTTPTAGVKKDVFVPMDANTSRQLPAYWLSEKCGAGHDALYPSCVLEKLTLKGEDTGKLNAAGNFRGSGKQLLGEDLALVAETQKYYLKNTQASIIRAAAATPGTTVETYACGLQSFMFDIDNAPDQQVGYDPGCQRFYTAGDADSGIIRSYHLFGTRKYNGQFVVWLEDSAPELALLRAQTPLYLKMKMEGSIIGATIYKNTLELEMHLAYYKTVEIGNKNGFVTLQITPDAFYSESANKIVSATVQYATPA